MLFYVCTLAGKLNDVKPGLIPHIHVQIHAGSLPDQCKNKDQSQADNSLGNGGVFHFHINFGYVVDVQDTQKKPDGVVHHPVVTQYTQRWFGVETDDQDAAQNNKESTQIDGFLCPGNFKGSSKQVVLLNAMADQED